MDGNTSSDLKKKSSVLSLAEFASEGWSSYALNVPRIERGSPCYRGGLTGRVTSTPTSPAWASRRPALSHADANSRLNMCTSHGFHMSRYRCCSQLRTPGITFYPGEPNPSLKAVLLEYTYTFTLLVLYNAQFGAVVTI
jgi:hypothetical protein